MEGLGKKGLSPPTFKKLRVHATTIWYDIFKSFDRSSHWMCSVNKAVLKSFAILMGKQYFFLESIFNKQIKTEIKKDSNTFVFL